MTELLTFFATPWSIYVIVVAVIGIALLLWVYRSLSVARAVRTRKLSRQKVQQSLRTSSPLDNPTEITKERGLEAIQKQFTVTQKVAVPLILGATGLAMGLPFFSHIPATILSLLATAVTVLLGIAARPAVENAIAGLVISSSRILNIGDTVLIDGNYGIVEDITATHTAVKLWDWRRYLVPNSEMLRRPLLNYSLYDRFIWTYAEFWVGPDADLEEVREVALAAARASAYFAEHEAPRFWVMEMQKDAVKCWVAAWANSPSDAWLLGSDIRTTVACELRRRGIPTQGFRLVDHRESG